MLLFKDYHINPIQQGKKTHTRRIWDEPRAKKGAIHLAKTQMLSTDFFARLKILDVYKERLGDISAEDAMKEGGYTVNEFKRIFDRINKKNGGWDPDLEVHVVEFKCIPNVDLKPGDKVRMSPECAEYLVHGDTIWIVDSTPWRAGFSELVFLKGFSGGFSTKFLEKVGA